MLRPAMVAALLLAGACAAEPEPTRGEPALELTGRVVDAAEILDASFEEELTQRLAQLEADTQVQLVVATTPDLMGQDIATYSVELARDWDLGDRQRRDGIMLLIAPNHRQVRIEVGYGLEASVRDEEAAEIIREVIVPEFEQDDFEAGILGGVESLVREVTPYVPMDAA